MTLRLDYYDGTLTLHSVSPQRMEGEYSRQTSKGMIHIPLMLVPHHEVGAGKAVDGAEPGGRLAFHWPTEKARRRHAGELPAGDDG